MASKAVKTNQQKLYSTKYDIAFAETSVDDPILTPYIVQIFIFYGENFLGWDCFQKDKILIGSNENADLILVGDGVQEFHATAYVKGDQVIVTDKTNGSGLVVNKKGIKDVILGNFDFIKIGPYSLKIKVKVRDDNDIIQKSDITYEYGKKEKRPPVTIKNEITVVESGKNEIKISEIYKKKVKSEDIRISEIFEVTDVKILDENRNEFSSQVVSRLSDLNRHKKFNLVCDGRILYGKDPRKVAKNLVELLKSSELKIQKLLSGTPVILKKNVDYKTAEKLRTRLEKAGLLAFLKEVTPVTYSDEFIAVPAQTPKKVDPKLPELHDRKKNFYFEEDEDDDEEDIEADFLLLEKLLNHGLPENAFHQEGKDIIEVIKYKGNYIVDVSYLEEDSRYIVTHEKKDLCLVENFGSSGSFFYFKEDFNGKLKKNDLTETELNKLKTPENMTENSECLYKDFLTENSKVIIEDGLYEYHIQLVKQAKLKTVKEKPGKPGRFKQFLLKSVAFHLVCMAVFGLIHLVKPVRFEKLPETYFVRMNIDNLSSIHKNEPLITKMLSEKTKQPQEIKSSKTESEKKTLPENKTIKEVKTSSNKKSRKSQPAAVSKSPDAGGGFGKGNVTNRNVNEAGILGILGSNVGPSSINALAAVTNLDAVASSSTSSGDFKVGGIAGKLSSSKISVTSPGLVGTKGSKQVLRSYGASGEGSVAALEKGKTGQKQVMGMVTASLSKKVRIQGGMSREAVKKVIDAHLDEISYCYETALIENPSIIGKVVFEWKIMASGNVGEVKIKSSSINSSQIHSCIKSCIKSWQFPEPTGSEVIVSYPFIFDIVGF